MFSASFLMQHLPQAFLAALGIRVSYKGSPPPYSRLCKIQLKVPTIPQRWNRKTGHIPFCVYQMVGNHNNHIVILLRLCQGENMLASPSSKTSSFLEMITGGKWCTFQPPHLLTSHSTHNKRFLSLRQKLRS